MAEENVLLSTRDDAVAILTMNRPAQKNALNTALLEALAAGLSAAGEDKSVGAIVLTGNGNAFCSGADLKAAMTDPGAFDRLDETMGRYHAVIRAIVGAPKPVIALCDGAAVGFGCDLALACDLRYATEAAYFQEKFVKIGLIPDGGGTFWLPRLIGMARAMEIMLTGESVNARDALAMGLINRMVASPDALREEGMKLAHKLSKGAPLAYEGIKRAVRKSFGGTIDQALDAERETQVKLLKSNDCIEGVMAWMQKREPNFTGK
jgi:enoyl-CoA hydratase/carnithine racemase